MKKAVSHKVDENILKEFNEIADKNALNKSKWLENKMKEYIEQNKEV